MRTRATSNCLILRLAAFAGVAMALSACTTAPKHDVVYPSDAPPGNSIISDFRSWNSANGNRRKRIHQGIDIGGPPGQPVIAIADGRVAETHVEKCWGPTVVVDHGYDKDGKPLIALYGHVGEILVEAGQAVSRGDVIARLGDNQYKFGCIGAIRHLHLQLGRARRIFKGERWGHAYFLRNPFNSLNPHLLWADGAYRVTCFDENREYAPGTLTYPVPCGS